MKLSTLVAKLASGKAKALGMVGGLAVAGAALMVAAPVASAQHVRFGVEIGVPRYVAPAPVYVAPESVYVAAAPAYVAPAYGYVAPGYWDHRGVEVRARDGWDRGRDGYGRPAAYRRDGR